MSQRRKQHAKKKKRAVRGSFLSERLEEANTDKKGFVQGYVSSISYKNKSHFNLRSSLYKIVYIDWMSCFWTDDISRH